MSYNIVFFGSHSVSIPMLEYLLNKKNINISYIVSQPDRASGRGKILKPTAISEWALSHKITLLRPNKPNEQLVKQIEKCDLILVMAYGHILRDYILSLPRLGIFNFHASILPKYRGASPVETAIACGEKITGISLMEIIPQMDAGDIIDTDTIEIAPTDYASDIYTKLSRSCIKILDKQLENLITGNIVKHQQESASATYTRKTLKQDGQINYNLSVCDIFNRIRGFHEHVGTYTKINNMILNIGHCEIYSTDEQFNQTGEILLIDKEKILISTKHGILAIFEIQRLGGKLLNIRDFTNGFSLKIGDVFESAHSNNIISRAPFSWK